MRGLKSARLGAIGARPGNFNTTRYSEKLLQAAGMSVVTVDLSEILGNAQRLGDQDARVQQKLANIRGYLTTDGIPSAAVVKQAKVGVVIDDWMSRI